MVPSVCLLFGGLLVQYLSSENTVRDDEIDGRLMAILYRDYFDSVKIPTGINLTPNFLHTIRQCLISSAYLHRQFNNMISVFRLTNLSARQGKTYRYLKQIFLFVGCEDM